MREGSHLAATSPSSYLNQQYEPIGMAVISRKLNKRITYLDEDQPQLAASPYALSTPSDRRSLRTRSAWRLSKDNCSSGLGNILPRPTPVAPIIPPISMSIRGKSLEGREGSQDGYATRSSQDPFSQPASDNDFRYSPEDADVNDEDDGDDGDDEDDEDDEFNEDNEDNEDYEVDADDLEVDPYSRRRRGSQ